MYVVFHQTPVFDHPHKRATHKFFYKVAKVVRKACEGGGTRIRCLPEAAAEGSTGFW